MPENKTLRESRRVPCILTDDEKTAIAKDAMESIAELTDLERAKKNAGKDFDNKIAATKEKIETLARAHREGIEQRLTPCTITLDYDRGVYLVCREDTGETVQERTLTADERQLALMGDDQ